MDPTADNPSPPSPLRPLSARDRERLRQMWLTARELETHWPDPERMKLLEHRAPNRLTSDHEDSIELMAAREAWRRLRAEPSPQNLVAWITSIESVLGVSSRDGDWPHPVRIQDRVQAEITSQLILVLDNVRSAFNVGSILRTADAVGGAEVWCCGYTPNPDHPMVKKTSLSAPQVRTRHFASIGEALQELRTLKCPVYALETANSARNIFEWSLPERMALVLGNERFGLEASTLAACDGVLEIPMGGIKNSLNVAVALGVFAYEHRRQNPLQPHSAHKFPVP